MQVGLPLFSDKGDKQIAMAIYHAVSLVILDGLCLGIDVAGDKQKEQILFHCIEYLNHLLKDICIKSWSGIHGEEDFVQNDT